MGESWRRVHLPVTGSTQEDVHRLAEAGAPAGTVLRADVQTHGRGRGEHGWSSPRGGLWLSLLLRPRRRSWGLLPILAGVSVAAVIAPHGVDARVKWPNDILVEDRKVCGILLTGRTASGADGRAGHAVLGIGLNANLNVEDLPPDVRDHATTLRAETGKDIPLPDLQDTVLGSLAPRLDRWEAGEDTRLVEEWRRWAWGRGTEVELPDGTRGTAEDLAEDGTLVVRRGSGATVRVTDGESLRWLARGNG